MSAQNTFVLAAAGQLIYCRDALKPSMQVKNNYNARIYVNFTYKCKTKTMKELQIHYHDHHQWVWSCSTALTWIVFALLPGPITCTVMQLLCCSFVNFIIIIVVINIINFFNMSCLKCTLVNKSYILPTMS